MLNIEKYKDEILNEYQQLFGKDTSSCSDGTKMNKAIKAIAFKHCGKRFLGASSPFKWLCEEYKEPILDDVERDYLSAVIKPFRKRIKYIEIRKIGSKTFVHIELSGGDCMSFPNFKENTMYKGMKKNKHYSLDELGL